MADPTKEAIEPKKEELTIDELAAVNGGTWMDTVGAVAAAAKAITGIQGVLGKAIEDLPPVSSHLKT